ncbi:MAG TPA: hypothetical protein VIM14_00190 [Polyangia bacterium]
MMSSLLLGVLIAVHPVIASHLGCPSSRDIESQLSVLLPDTAQPGTVVVSAATDGLLVDLRPDNLAFAATRTLTVGSDCEERARAAAVVISTWWPVTGATPRPPEATATVSAEPAATDTRARSFALGAGSFASLVSDGAAVGGRLEADWLPRWARGFGLRMSSAYTGSHTSPVGQGQAQWSRATAEIGPTYSLGHARFDAGAVASLFWIRGTGFEVSQRSQGSAVGATLGARMAWPWKRVVPCIEIRGFLWPQSQTIYVLDATTGSRKTHALPQAELQLGGGIALAF